MFHSDVDGCKVTGSVRKCTHVLTFVVTISFVHCRPHTCDWSVLSTWPHPRSLHYRSSFLFYVLFSTILFSIIQSKPIHTLYVLDILTWQPINTVRLEIPLNNHLSFTCNILTVLHLVVLCLMSVYPFSNYINIFIFIYLILIVIKLLEHYFWCVINFYVIYTDRKIIKL